MVAVKTSAETSASLPLSGAELVRIVQSGANAKASVADFRTGNVTFPATQVPSSDPNTLDDYEEGTFTPSIGDNVGNAYTVNFLFAAYRKIGSVLSFGIFIGWNSIGSAGAGQLRISGLPFAVGGGASQGYGTSFGFLQGLDLTATLNPPITDLFSGNTYMTFYRANDNAAPTALPANSSSAAGNIEMSGTYFV